MSADVKLMGIYIEHPTGHERVANPDVQSRVYMGVTVGKQEKIREIPLDENALIKLIADAADRLTILRKIRR